MTPMPTNDIYVQRGRFIDVTASDILDQSFGSDFTRVWKSILTFSNLFSASSQEAAAKAVAQRINDIATEKREHNTQFTAAQMNSKARTWLENLIYQNNPNLSNLQNSIQSVFEERKANHNTQSILEVSAPALKGNDEIFLDAMLSMKTADLQDEALNNFIHEAKNTPPMGLSFLNTAPVYAYMKKAVALNSEEALKNSIVVFLNAVPNKIRNEVAGIVFNALADIQREKLKEKGGKEDIDTLNSILDQQQAIFQSDKSAKNLAKNILNYYRPVEFYVANYQPKKS